MALRSFSFFSSYSAELARPCTQGVDELRGVSLPASDVALLHLPVA